MASIRGSLALAAFLLVDIGARALASEHAQDSIHVINVDEREPLGLILIAPTGEISNTSRSQIYQLISELLRARTRFTLRPLESAAAVDKCGGHLGCLILDARPDFDRDAEKKTAVRNPVRWLVFLSLQVAAPGQDRLTALLVDADQALDVYRAERDEFDEMVFRYAVRAQPSAILLRSPADVAPALEKIFFEQFPGPFLSEHDVHTLGTLELLSARDGVQIELDGTAIGTTQGGVTRVVGLAEGTRHLIFTHPGFETLVRDVDLKSGGAETIDLVLITRVSESAAILRKGLFWGGLGTAAIGAGITVASLAQSSSATTSRVCIGTPGSVCSDVSGFVRSGGVLTGPLGWSVALAGGTWILGSQLEDDSLSWLAIGAGVALGVASYSLAVLLEASDGSGIKNAAGR